MAGDTCMVILLSGVGHCAPKQRPPMPPLPPPLPPMPPGPPLPQCHDDSECKAGWICRCIYILLPGADASCACDPAPPATCQTNMECPIGQTCWKTLPGVPAGLPGMCGVSQPCNTNADCKQGQHCKQSGFCGKHQFLPWIG